MSLSLDALAAAALARVVEHINRSAAQRMRRLREKWARQAVTP